MKHGNTAEITTELGTLFVEVHKSERDGHIIVEIDTSELQEDSCGPLCRIYLNDHCLHENPPFPQTRTTTEYVIDD